MKHNESKSYTIHIFDEDYSLISDEKEEHVMQAAALVDQTMHEMSAIGLVDKKKIAVLAALQIASSYLQVKHGLSVQKQDEQKIADRIQQLLTSLS